jgi:phage gpG-like protein
MAVVRTYDAALAALLRGPSGQTAQDLARLGVRVTNAAKLNATGQPRVRTGRLRSSIAWRLGADARGLYVEVGSNVSYARVMELGSPPHEIRPRNKKALAWPGGAHPVKRVRHPGTRPYRYLARAIRAAR